MIKRTWGILGINLTVVCQWASILFLPTLFKDLNFSSSQMGNLSTSRLLAMSISLPFFSWMSYYFHRGKILGVSLVMSGLFTCLNIFFINQYPHFMICNMLSGVSLGSIIPVSRSLISNYFELKERGTYYGTIEISSGIGGIVGSGISIFISNQQNTLPIESWKVTYLTLGFLCIVCGILCFFIIPDPYYIKKPKTDFPHFEEGERLLPTIKEFKSLLKKRTFIMQIVGGCTGSMPWSGLQFLILFFERMGMGKLHPVLIFASVALSAALGGGLGGWLGDKAASKDSSLGRVFGRLYGRTWISHISIYSGIILSVLLVKIIPYEKDEWWKFAIMGGVMGVSIALVPANNAAIQSDLFPQNLHSCSFAVQFFFEGFFSSLSPLLVGVFNDYVFHGKELAPKGGNEEWEGFSEEKKKHLLEGLANSIIIICSVFWFLCALTEYPIYYYYPRESRELLKEENDRREKTSIQSLESRTGKI